MTDPSPTVPEVRLTVRERLDQAYRRLHIPVAVGDPCPACQTVLQGPYCHACGLDTTAHHRSLWVFLVDMAKSLTSYDSKLVRTLRGLLLTPGRFVRAYIEGQRSDRLPPLRLFFVALMVLFLVASVVARSGLPQPDASVAPRPMAERYKLVDGVQVYQPPPEVPVDTSRGFLKGLADLKAELDVEARSDGRVERSEAWLSYKIGKVLKAPGTYFQLVLGLGNKLVIVFLPLMVLALAILCLGKRSVRLYDLGIVSLYSLSVGFAALTGVLLLPLSLWGYGFAALMGLFVIYL
ncbi:MAG: DUF3667 domain-containing protein, partial [Asticcacaulis sp.]